VDWNKGTERVIDVANKNVEVDGAATYSNWGGESCLACSWIIDLIQKRKYSLLLLVFEDAVRFLNKDCTKYVFLDQI
jgi:hypothetical protein